MPAPAIVGAVVSIGFAATATGTVATAFAVAAAIGATAAAVGQITGVKELTIAGTVLGAVGAVGGLASSAGLFGAEAGSLFGAGEAASNVTNAAGGGAGEVAQAAVTAGPAPTGGYSFSAVADPSLANLPSDVISQAGGGTSDIVDMLNGAVSQAPLAEPPVIADKAVVDVSTPAATNEVATAQNVLPDPMKDVVSAEGLTPDPAKGLIDQPAVAMAEAPVLDPAGNVIPQGDGGPLGSPAGMDGQEAVDLGGFNDAGQSNVTGADQPTPAASVTGQTSAPPTNASATPGSTANAKAVTGQVATGTPPAAAPAAASNMPSPEKLIYEGNVGGSIQRADNSIWGNIWKFTKDNPAIAMGGIMAASSFLSGAMSPLTPAQTKALDSQAEQNLAAANLANTQNELLQRRLDNMRQGIPQARLKNPTGLINMPVTGAPA